MAATPPRLPDAPQDYEQTYFNTLLRVLRLYFNNLAAVTDLRVNTLNIDVDRLPTQVDVANLRRGDVYRDSTAGDVLKIKT